MGFTKLDSFRPVTVYTHEEQAKATMGIGSVHIRLLGAFAVSVEGAQVPDDAWRLRKARSLVKLLALDPRHRLHWEQIGEALWPDRDAAAVRNNIHQVLRAARDAIGTLGVDGHDVLRLRDGIVSFRDDVAVSVDVEEFTAAAEHALNSASLEAYRAAAALYTGELLPEDRYDDTLDAPREALREQHSSLLLEMARLHLGRGEQEAAIDVLRTLLLHHELHEPARRELMQVLAESGRRQEALREFESLRDALRRTLEADPDPETRRLYRRLLAGSLEDDGPVTLETEDHPTDNLPAAVSSFIGRDRELGEVERLLSRTRLLTLTGVGGAGKTRLAIEVARRQVDAFEHGVWLTDLAPASDPEQVPLAVAEVLGLDLPERGPFVPALVDQLADRRLLLLLDNCEHLVDACAALVAGVLGGSSGVVVLATSREALRVEGEVAWRVPSLSLPDLNRLPEHAALARQAAVRLFSERAGSAQPGFELTSRNARTVAELCVRLDGMPLALELAAARVRMLSPAQILQRLGDALDVLGSVGRAGLSRQQTLSATLDWSHELLDEAERVVFRRLAVFAGSFSLEVAEDVCGLPPLERSEVLALLGRLVDQSLVVVEPHGEVSRYRLLETVRQYAGDRLTAAGERAAVEQRHRDWYRGWATARDPERSAAAGEESLRHFDVEHGNLRAALRSALVDEPEAALDMATSLWRFWLARGHFAEGRRWLEAALEANPSKSALRARGLIAITVLDMRYAAGPARLEQAAAEVVDIHRDLGDEPALAQALHLAALLLWITHRTDDAIEHLDRSCLLASDLGAEHVLAAASHTRGVVALSRGRAADAQSHFAACDELLARVDATTGGFFPAITIGFSVEWDADRPRIVFEETLVLGHRLDAGPAVAYLRLSQAWAARAAQDPHAGIAYAEKGAAGFAAEGWDFGVALAENLLGSLYRSIGDHDRSRRCLERSLQLRARLGDRRATGVTLCALGLLAGAEGDTDEAQRHLQRALDLFERIEDHFAAAGALLDLGVVSLRAGELDAAQRRFEQARELHRAPGGRRMAAWATVMLAEIAAHRDDDDAVAGHLAAARSEFADLGEQMGLRYCDRHG